MTGAVVFEVLVSGHRSPFFSGTRYSGLHKFGCSQLTTLNNQP
jgi:hypothetical protein